MSWDDSKRRLLRTLQDTVAERLAGDEVEPVQLLAEQLLEAFPAAELRARGLPDLFGWLVGTWRFLQNFNAWQPKVRVFNPDYQRHGWHSGHTVVAILCREQPFTADSVRNELNSRGIDILTIQYIPLRVARDADHQLQTLLGADHSGELDVQREALLYLEIRRNTDADELYALQRSLDLLLSEVGLVVDDFMPMLARVKQARDDVAAMTVNDAYYRQEVMDLLEWLVNGHFTFLGYEYLEVDYQGDAPQVHAPVAQKLGLLRLRDTLGVAELERELETDNTVSSADEHRHCVTFVQSSVRNRVHRHVYPDYVNIRIFDQQGRLASKHRFLGLYTSRAYNLNPTHIPLVRRKISAVMQRAAFDPQGQKSSELLRVLETYPRDDLFQATTDQLYVAAMGILDIQERRQVRLFVREDPRGRFVSCQVFIPRDKYNTELRQRVQTLLSDAFHATESEFTTFFSESILIRTHFIFRVQPSRPAVDTAALEQELAQVTMNWHDHLRVHLLDECGEERGSELASLYQQAFPAGYMEDFDPRTAILDIQRSAELSDDNPLSLSLYRMNNDSPEQMRFRLLHLHQPLALSDVMPILENLGLRVEGERPHGIRRRDGLVVWMHEFSVVYKLSGTLDIHQVGDVFEDAFARIWAGQAESDSFNRLILGTQLGWRPIAMLRAYAKYMKQTQFTFSTEFIADTLARQMDITRMIVELFELRLKPGLDVGRERRQQAAEEVLQQALENVGSLSEDRVIRQYLALIQATLRSNYYQSDARGQLKTYFSFKLNPEAVPDMPLPRPLYEIFVYSPRVEGVHLRGGKVARGGLRWSDRYEDFRTEVLGLVKAQQVKNSVIVPTGAKGGFVCKSLDADAGRDVRQAEAIACYRIFIQGLLDITDNLVGGEVVPPRDVTRHDDDDPYLVVAADKGTATFSDFANEIAASYNFWLGDAFASGGSQGYDHKKMGITARGAWVSVQRHFRELGINIQTTPFTVIGIGDMAGDVFGNGMLRSAQIKLLAAFNHQHIFIDPTPDPETSFAERQRLFALPRSSWEDYDKALISSGGGVFSRSAKSISLSPEIRQHLAIDAERLTPAELIHALLQAPVDLLWNGGIGTYIKASTQSHADCGDKANDALRVNGNELRCKVLGEGGNLGATQLGRIEYALRGGRCNTDFVDNAGGVDCSDHEVNIKILLNAVMAAGDMTEKQRRVLLEAMTDDVAELVLANIYRQTQAISLAEREALMRLGEYRRLIQALE
ncbi:MAG TPA: NAD-glutamate dehydrogenase, partial [Spongiibacteraceae bacterium]|nr:NAD-glutamate dehydrogenase [Spongiibacteraceae bacterium]